MRFFSGSICLLLCALLGSWLLTRYEARRRVATVSVGNNERETGGEGERGGCVLGQGISVYQLLSGGLLARSSVPISFLFLSRFVEVSHFLRESHLRTEPPWMCPPCFVQVTSRTAQPQFQNLESNRRSDNEITIFLKKKIKVASELDCVLFFFI